MPRMKDKIGQTFGRLTVLSVHHTRNKHNQVMWDCVCDCGTRTTVVGHVLRKGESKSCGCLMRERAAKLHTTHGCYGTPENRAWNKMKERILNPNYRRWKDYGGRGIKMCQRWTDSFESFLEDMGPKPSPDHSIDRIDNNGDYEPGNCRWATRIEQANNTSQNVIIVGMTMADYCRENGIKYKSFHRLYRTEKQPLEVATKRARRE